MKKALLPLLLLIFTAGASFAQSFQIVDINGTEIPSGTTLSASGPGSITFPAGPPIKVRTFLVNSSGADLTLNVKRYIITPLAGSQDQVCFGIACYNTPNNYWVGPTPEVIADADTNKSFFSYFFPNGNAGVMVARVVFFNVNNPSDTAYIDINYTAEPLGINEEVSAPTVGGAYPNPAKDVTFFDYDLNSATTGTIKIYDMTGSLAKEVPLIENSGKIKVQLDDLKAGVYFYHFIANNKTIATRRLVVTK